MKHADGYMDMTYNLWVNFMQGTYNNHTSLYITLRAR